MCSPTLCRQCRKVTYSGCGLHIEEALSLYLAEERCTCLDGAPAPA